MYNYVMLIGTVTNISDVSTEFDTLLKHITLELNEQYFRKPIEFDLIVADYMTRELYKGAKVAIKGKLYPNRIFNSIDIVAERIMFMSNVEE